MEKSGSGYTAVAGCCDHGKEPSVFVNCREFNHYLRKYQISRRSLICGIVYLYKLTALLETLFDLVFVYNTEVYVAQSKFVAVLNCAPNMTTYVGT